MGTKWRTVSGEGGRYCNSAGKALSSSHRRRLDSFLFDSSVTRLEHLHYDGGDVVEATAAVRFSDQGVDHARRGRARGKELLDTAVIDHPGETVARDEKDVTRADFTGIGVGLHLSARSHAPRDHVAV